MILFCLKCFHGLYEIKGLGIGDVIHARYMEVLNPGVVKPREGLGITCANCGSALVTISDDLGIEIGYSHANL